jgi:hypothetical protein
MRIFRIFNRFEKKNELEMDVEKLYSPSIAFSWNSFVNELVEHPFVRYWDDVFFDTYDPQKNNDVYDLIFLNYHNQSLNDCEDVSMNKVYSTDFLNSRNERKILIDCTYCFVDPQEFTLSTLGMTMYKSNAFDLYSPILFEQLRDYNMRVSKMNRSFDDLKEYVSDSNVIVFRLAQTPSFWRKFEKREKFLSFFKAPTNILNDINDVNNRSNDVIMTGNKSSFIYPLRNSIREKFNSKANAFTTLDTFEAYLFDRGKTKAIASDFSSSSKSIDLRNKLHKEMNLIYRQTLDNYCFFLKKSKIGIVCSSIYGYPVAKYFELFAQGVLVIGDMPIDGSEYGLINNETMVECTLDNVEDKVLYYLNNSEERERITRNALNFIHTSYNSKANISLLFEEINSHLDGKESSR